MFTKHQIKSAMHLLTECGQAKSSDRILVIYEISKIKIKNLLQVAARKCNLNIMYKLIKRVPIHGAEPPDGVALLMRKSSLVLCLTQMSMAHTRARLQATLGGTRFLSLPDYDMDVLTNQAMTIHFSECKNLCIKVAKKINNSKSIFVTTSQGTNLQLGIFKRKVNICPGFVSTKFPLGSPPDVEVNLAPHELQSNGKLVVDISIPHPKIGLLRKPVSLFIKNGSICKIQTLDNKVKKILTKLFFQNPCKRRMVLAEIGIGLNKRAVPNGKMLIDEGAYGTIHFGFGSNITIGGINKTNFHLDFIVSKPNLWADRNCILKKGKLLI